MNRPVRADLVGGALEREGILTKMAKEAEDGKAGEAVEGGAVGEGAKGAEPAEDSAVGEEWKDPGAQDSGRSSKRSLLGGLAGRALDAASAFLDSV